VWCLCVCVAASGLAAADIWQPALSVMCCLYAHLLCELTWLHKLPDKEQHERQQATASKTKKVMLAAGTLAGSQGCNASACRNLMLANS